MKPSLSLLSLLPFGLLHCVGVAAANAGDAGIPPKAPLSSDGLAALVGTPVDIAPSAYQYRADRPAADNPPESWLALMHFARQPLDRPLDQNAPAIKRVACSLLWEEIRPVRQLELTWSTDPRRQPAPGDLTIATLDNKGTASSWWNNLEARPKSVAPALTNDRRTYLYELSTETCGVVVALAGDRSASDYEVPTMRVLTADPWKRMDVEIEWGFDPTTQEKDYSGRIETYDGRVAGLGFLDGDTTTAPTGPGSWRSSGQGLPRRGLKLSLLYQGTAKWRKVQPFVSQADDVARTIVTLWTQAGNFSFLAADLENGPILAPEYGFFVRRTSAIPAARPEPARPGKTAALPPTIPSEPPFALASQATSARAFIRELQARKLDTIRTQVRARAEQTWEGAVTALRGTNQPPHPAPPKELVPPMQVQVPSERLTAQWDLGVWHLLRHTQRHPESGRLWFNDHPYGILAAETYLILHVLDLMGSHQAAEDGFHQWVSLPMQPKSAGHHEWALPDRPNGLFSEGNGCLTHAVGPPGVGGHMDGVHAFGPGSIGWALTEHYWLTGDTAWLKSAASRIKANAEWMLRQRRVVSGMLPGGDRLWCRGLQPALQVTPDSGGLWMQFYECEAYYWASVSRFAATLTEVDPEGGARLAAEAEAYRHDLRAAVDRSIALSPVVQVRDGTFHSVIPFACYVRGLGTGAWGWRREGSGEHVGPLYWETVKSAAALISPARLLPPDDVRVQGYLDILEDRLLLENANVGRRDWFLGGWQYQAGLERTANLHLAADDVPGFLRTLLNGYAIDILPDQGYVFNEHAVHGPPDKIFEEAAFLERFRGLLVYEAGQDLWLNRAAPRAWLEQGKKISVRNAPTHFGPVAFEVTSNVDHGRISARVELPSRRAPGIVWLRLRHPRSAPITRVTVDGRDYRDWDPAKEAVRLHDLTGNVSVEVGY